jgi:hypothetical protein
MAAQETESKLESHGIVAAAEIQTVIQYAPQTSLNAQPSAHLLLGANQHLLFAAERAEDELLRSHGQRLSAPRPAAPLSQRLANPVEVAAMFPNAVSQALHSYIRQCQQHDTISGAQRAWIEFCAMLDHDAHGNREYRSAYSDSKDLPGGRFPAISVSPRAGELPLLLGRPLRMCVGGRRVCAVLPKQPNTRQLPTTQLQLFHHLFVSPEPKRHDMFVLIASTGSGSLLHDPNRCGSIDINSF